MADQERFVKNQGNLPQYGKKGHSPRKPYVRREENLDEIKTNKIEYWNKTSGFSNVSKFNWDLIVGRPRETSFTPIGVDPLHEYNPAQLMTIDVVMGPGWASNINDGVNRSLAMVMAKIRASLSTSNIGFETADLGIYFSSTASIAALIGYAKRIFESYTVWKDRNYVYPRALIAAQDCDYEDIRDNINKYAMQLNASIDMYNAMEIIDCWDVYDRQYSMCHNIFADEDSQYGQLYMFRPVGYYEYDDVTDVSKARFIKLKLAQGEGLLKGFPLLLNYIQYAIHSWYGSSDLYQINGVLLRAFKDAPRQKIPYYNLEDKIEPVVDRAFLMQIMNMTINSAMVYEEGALDITQEPTTQNYVIWKPTAGELGDAYTRHDTTTKILRLFEDDPTFEDNMEMTRLVNFPSFRGDETNGDAWWYENCGSEIVVGVNLLTYSTRANALKYHVLYSNFAVITDDFPSVEVNGALATVANLSPFRYIPAVTIIFKSAPGAPVESVEIKGLIGDMYNWMLYPKNDWNQLQFVAYQSLWFPKNL